MNELTTISMITAYAIVAFFAVIFVLSGDADNALTQHYSQLELNGEHAEGGQ